MTILVSICMLTGHIPSHYPLVALVIAASPFVLFLMEGRVRLALKGLGLVAVTVALNRTVLRQSVGLVNSLLLAITGIVLYMMPGLMMGYYSLVTTKISDLIGSLQKLGLPDTLIVPISVAFRFFYSTQQDYQTISESMKILGLDHRTFFKQPGKYLEYKCVPLLMVAVNSADNVAISAVARGMRIGRERSTISNAQLKLQDYIVLGILLALLVFYIFVRWEVAHA